MLSREQIIESLVSLQDQMSIQYIPQNLLRKALDANPWFTPYFIQERLRNIKMWLEKELLHQWLAPYPYLSNAPKRVGIIAAGNIPMVGLHDLISVILSGHIAYIKYSRRDQLLMEWFVDLWISQMEELQNIIFQLSPSHTIDMLIASGSNNTARYLSAAYPGIPRVIRKHRYSVAVLDSDITDHDIYLLKKDILLYNGLGCRNVCNLLIHKAYDWERIPYLFKQQDYRTLNPLYVDKVNFQRAKYQTLGISFEEGDCMLIVQSNNLESTEMGVLNSWSGLSDSDIDRIIETKKDEIQCVVNRGTEFGESQYPGLDIFEDNKNLLRILT